VTIGGASAGGWTRGHAVDGHLLAVHGHRLAGEQAADRHHRLLEQGQLGGGLGADPAHPLGNAVADAGDDPAGVDPREHGQLHCEQGGVAQRDRGDADPDPERAGGGQGQGGGADRAGPSQVLDQPEVGCPHLLDRRRVAGQLLGGPVALEHEADPGLGLIDHDTI
jgi:hypothetical protein